MGPDSLGGLFSTELPVAFFQASGYNKPIRVQKGLKGGSHGRTSTKSGADPGGKKAPPQTGRGPVLLAGGHGGSHCGPYAGVVLNKTSTDFLDRRAIVKRVIALGGDTVDIDYNSSVVYLNGQPLEESYLGEDMYWPGNPYMQQTHFEIPEGSVFVMGDNRNGSTDSRHELLGAVEEEFVLGRVFAILWPLDQLGLI